MSSVGSFFSYVNDTRSHEPEGWVWYLNLSVWFIKNMSIT